MKKRTHVLALDLGGTKLAGALVTRHGDVHKPFEIPTARGGGPGVQKQVIAAAREALAGARTAAAAIGISVPGLVRRDGTVWAPNIAHWKKVPLAAMIGRATGLPVVCESDRNASVVGEAWLGAARGATDAVYLIIGTGIGNLWDRLASGAVTDFMNLGIGPVRTGVFNVADLAIMGRPAADAIADVTLGDTVVNDADKALDVPGADEGWCDRTPTTTFTATDCNSLYFDQYAGTEYPARLDHLFARDPAGRIVATSSKIVFTDKLTFGDVEREPSDHFGVLAELVVTPR